MKKALARALFASVIMVSGAANAAPSDKSAAKDAYDRGLEAYKLGDVQKAADEFARADTLAPSPIALRAALDAAVEIDDPALGAELLERSRREPVPAILAPSVANALRKFRGRAARIHVTCPKGSTCIARVDDRPVEVDKFAWARTGQHTVTITVDGEPQTKSVDLDSDRINEIVATKVAPIPEAAPVSPVAPVEPVAEAPPPRLRRHHSDALPPIYFYGGVGLTGVFAILTTVSALDTSGKHGSFQDAGCNGNLAPASCAGLASDGQSAQTRTNVGLIVTAVVGVATAIIGAKFTDWSAPLFAFQPAGGSASWHATF